MTYIGFHKTVMGVATRISLGIAAAGFFFIAIGLAIDSIR